MSHHYDALINIPLAVVLALSPVWIPLIEEYSWTATTIIIPTLSIIYLTFKVRSEWKKHRQ